MLLAPYIRTRLLLAGEKSVYKSLTFTLPYSIEAHKRESNKQILTVQKSFVFFRWEFRVGEAAAAAAAALRLFVSHRSKRGRN